MQACIGTVITLLIIGVFWNTLTATAFWTLTLYQTKDHSATRITPEPELELTVATDIASSTVYDSIRTPHFFIETDVLPASDGVRTVFSDPNSNAYYLIGAMGAFKDGYVTGQTNTSTEASAAHCRRLTDMFSTNPCLSDASFLTVVMETSHQSAGLFSNPARKNAAATFLLIKSTYLPSATTRIAPFRSAEISGYIAYDSADSIAYFFDQNEIGYEMVFVNMDQAEIESILKSITSIE